MSDELARLFTDLFHAQLELLLAQSNRHISNDHKLLLFDVALPLFLDDFIPPVEPPATDRLGHARWRDEYNRTQRNRPKAAHWTQITVDAFWPFLTQLPQPTSQGQFSCDILIHPTTASRVAATFIANENPDFFKRLKSILTPRFNTKEPLDAHGTPLTQLLTPLTGSFAIERDSFKTHGIILAPPEHGKTQLIQTFAHRFLNEPDPPGLIILDPHGDAFNVIKPRVDPSRLVVMDPDTDPPAFNFLDFSRSSPGEALQTFDYLMSAISGGLSDTQTLVVPYLFKLLQVIRNCNLETLIDIVEENPRKPEQSEFAKDFDKLEARDRSFFINQFYAPTIQTTKSAIARKLYGAIGSITFRQMFSAPSNDFDPDAILRDRKVLLVHGAFNSLGADGMQIYLQFLVSQFYSAAMRRLRIPEKDRHLCIILADEASHVFCPKIRNILIECRKVGMGFLGATQLVEDIPTEVKAAIYGATAIKIAGPISDTDASIIAREMYTSKEAVRACTSIRHKQAEWMCHVKNAGMKEAVKFIAPFGVLEQEPEYPQPPPKPRAPPRAREPAQEVPTSPPRSAPPDPSPTASTPATERPRAERPVTPRNLPPEDWDTEY